MQIEFAKFAKFAKFLVNLTPQISVLPRQLSFHTQNVKHAKVTTNNPANHPKLLHKM